METNNNPVTLEEIVNTATMRDGQFINIDDFRDILHELALRIVKNGYSYEVITEVVIKARK